MAGGDGSDLSGFNANSSVTAIRPSSLAWPARDGVSLIASGTGTLVRANIRNNAAFEFELQIEDGAVQRGAYATGDFVL
jgi:hypothetical protein